MEMLILMIVTRRESGSSFNLTDLNYRQNIDACGEENKWSKRAPENRPQNVELRLNQ